MAHRHLYVGKTLGRLGAIITQCSITLGLAGPGPRIIWGVAETDLDDLSGLKRHRIFNGGQKLTPHSLSMAMYYVPNSSNSHHVKGMH